MCFAEQAVFGRVVGGGQQVGQQQALTIVAGLGRAESGFEAHGALAAVEVGDAVAGHPKQPGRGLLHGLEQPVAFHELGKYVLEQVFGLSFVGNAPPDELQQPGPLLPHGFGNVAVLLRGRHRDEGRGEGKGEGFHAAIEDVPPRQLL